MSQIKKMKNLSISDKLTAVYSLVALTVKVGQLWSETKQFDVLMNHLKIVYKAFPSNILFMMSYAVKF